ncbi:MAG: hypothetical protein IH987_04105 [Planctomycetes bacterium]|nr:hypothetical protein [Planctomycetota bacterium]
MNVRKAYRTKDHKRRAVVVVQVVVLLGLLVGTAALTIDLGGMFAARADLQRTADAAALAAVSGYVTDDMMLVRLADGDSELFDDVVNMSQARGVSIGASNGTYGTDSTYLPNSDITLGWIDVTSATSPIDITAALDQNNAVQVVARRNGSFNGPVEFLFASIFGYYSGNVTATATAAFDDRVLGFDPGVSPGYLLPFTINRTEFETQLAAGNDDYSFDNAGNTVDNSADGIGEIDIYPGNLAPGNFGLLNIGTPNQSTLALAAHVENGVPAQDLAAEIGTTTLAFFDSSGDPITYPITGDPGIKAALESSIELRVGDIIAFLLHDMVVEQGSNAVYTITDIRFGRLMDVRVKGASHQRGLWIQPVLFAGPGVILDPAAPSTNGRLGQLVLVR